MSDERIETEDSSSFTGGDKRKAQALRPAAFEELRLLKGTDAS